MAGSAPVRIQLRRSRGWRMPEGAVKVDRTTPFGNPFRVGVDGTREDCVRLHGLLLWRGLACVSTRTRVGEQLGHKHWVYRHLHLLRGVSVACWCPEGAPCHGDTLMAMAAAVEVERLDLATRRCAAYAHQRRYLS